MTELPGQAVAGTRTTVPIGETVAHRAGRTSLERAHAGRDEDSARLVLDLQGRVPGPRCGTWTS